MATRTVYVTSKTGTKYGPYTYSKGGGGGAGGKKINVKSPTKVGEVKEIGRGRSWEVKAPSGKVVSVSSKAQADRLSKGYKAKSKAKPKAKPKAKADAKKAPVPSWAKKQEAGMKDAISSAEKYLKDNPMHHDKYSNTSKAEVSFVKEKKACGY